MAREPKDQPRGLDRTRALMLGALVIVATVGAIQLLSGDDAAPDPDEGFVDEGVVEISPVLPSNAIVSASWRTEEERERSLDAAAEAEEAKSESQLDQVGFGDEAEKRDTYDKSVEETVRGIEGLGVYVAPNKPDEPKKKK